MFHVVLYQPEIAPNTGNIIRLCANTGARLHLIHPLGFMMDESRLRRAALDYRQWASVREHRGLGECLQGLGPHRLLAFSSKARRNYAEFRYRPGDALLFGPETRGLPDDVLKSVPETRRLTIPMRNATRSLNLANAVAVACYEAWRQQGFAIGNFEDPALAP